MNSVKLYGRLTNTNPLTISKNIAGREAGPSSKDGSGRS